MVAPLTRAYANFASSLRFASLPGDAIATVRLGVTDCAGVILASLHEPVVGKLARWCAETGGTPQAHMLFGAQQGTASQAAYVNAVAAHALDYDDYAFSNHPSAVLLPTVLAAGEAAGADGRQMMTAYVAGYEIWADIMLREPDHIYPRGWHPTAMFGPIGAAAAASVVFGLDATRTMHAMALAASIAGGVFENFGTMAKPMHGGRAAETGLVAAGLARAGIEASPTALEGERGLLRAVSPNFRSDRARPVTLGEVWHIEKHKLNIKKYPTVGASQRLIDSAIAFRQAHAIDIARIRSIEPHFGDKHDMVMPFKAPKTALEAKFSAEFAVACALANGAVGLMQLKDEVVAAAPMQALMGKVRRDVTTDFDPNYTNAAPFDFIAITMDDGSVLRTPDVRRASGHADNPLDAAGLKEKFDDCAAFGGVDAAWRDRLFERMQSLDTLASAADIPSRTGA